MVSNSSPLVPLFLGVVYSYMALFHAQGRRNDFKCTRIFYKQLLYKQGSTRQGKKLSNFSTGLKTAKQFEKLYFQYFTGNVNWHHLINRNNLCKRYLPSLLVDFQYLSIIKPFSVYL